MSRVAIPRKLKKPTKSVTVVRMIDEDWAGSYRRAVNSIGITAPENPAGVIEITIDTPMRSSSESSFRSRGRRRWRSCSRMARSRAEPEAANHPPSSDDPHTVRQRKALSPPPELAAENFRPRWPHRRLSSAVSGGLPEPDSP
jgi:hypothetical protein